VAKVNETVNKALKSGDLAKRLADIGAEARGGTPEDFSKFWRSELVRYEGLVKLSSATLDCRLQRSEVHDRDHRIQCWPTSLPARSTLPGSTRR